MFDMYIQTMKNNLCVYPAIIFIVFVNLLAPAKSSFYRPHHVLTNQGFLSGNAWVYDGDSIFLGTVEVRLDAIDAPEHDQACRDNRNVFFPCGIVARDALRSMIGTAIVRCKISGRDRYHRLLGVCYSHGYDLNAAMVKKGEAIAYHYFSEAYASQESYAKARRLGIWQQANFTEPYYCRHFEPGHTCYEYNYQIASGRIAKEPLIGKSHATGTTSN